MTMRKISTLIGVILKKYWVQCIDFVADGYHGDRGRAWHVRLRGCGCLLHSGLGGQRLCEYSSFHMFTNYMAYRMSPASIQSLTMTHIHCNIVTPRPSYRSPACSFTIKIMESLVSSTILATCLAYLNIIDLVAVTILGDICLLIHYRIKFYFWEQEP